MVENEWIMPHLQASDLDWLKVGTFPITPEVSQVLPFYKGSCLCPVEGMRCITEHYVPLQLVPINILRFLSVCICGIKSVLDFVGHPT